MITAHCGKSEVCISTKKIRGNFCLASLYNCKRYLHLIIEDKPFVEEVRA